jgi:resuscitation-promoting factor RpfB
MKKTLLWAMLTLFVATPVLVAWVIPDGGTPSQEVVTTTTTTTPQVNYGAAEAAIGAYEAQVAAYKQAQLDAFFAELQRQEAARKAQEAQKAEQARTAARAAQNAPQATSGVSGSVWDRLAQCETGGNWSHPTVSGGFSGGLMFHYATWNAYGGQTYASTASGATREQQIIVAEKILAAGGWGQWPGCSRKLGLR